VFPPSYHYIGWTAGSLDRYLLPLVPLAIALALWGLRGARISLPLGTTVAVAVAIVAVAGTRDYLVFMREVWAVGDEAVAAGVPLDRLDAGSAWDGYYLYEYGRDNHIRSRTPKGGPWWVYFYAPATDSAYVVSTKPRPRYFVTEKRSYSSWLLHEPQDIFLLRRWGTTWPPSSGVRPVLKPAAPGAPAPVTTAAPTAMPVPTVSRTGWYGPGQKGEHANDTT